LRQDELFPTDVILHFSHHKCLTGYFNLILSGLSDEFRFESRSYTSDLERFTTAVLQTTGKRVLSLNNHSDIPFARFSSYRGSHFIRDPRDLIVSGYRYHLWTGYPWCIPPQFDWGKIPSHPLFTTAVEPDPRRFPQGISYREYLNQLDLERGLILELLWRQKFFQNMALWDAHNENIIELRYEEIIGNEAESFQRIFTHYQFHPQMVARGVALAEQLSLKNVKKKETGHVRKGSPRQWSTEFTPTVKQLFKELNGDLLITLGYEKDLAW
jgi:hypothetical protein